MFFVIFDINCVSGVFELLVGVILLLVNIMLCVEIILGYVFRYLLFFGFFLRGKFVVVLKFNVFLSFFYIEVIGV